MVMTQTSSSEWIVDMESGAASDSSQTTRILIADKFEQSGIDALDELGCAVRVDPEITSETLAEAVEQHDPDILIVRSTKVQHGAIERGKGLNLIIRAGAGFDTIDVQAASDRGIFVANCPGRNSVAVAELTWALILCCDRRVPDQTADLRRGIWNKKEYANAAGLYGKTLGIVGLGQIGREVAKRGKAFGMNVVAWSRSLTEETSQELGIGYASKLINLAKMADVISVNIAATAETKHLIGEQFCQAMRERAYLINTSRGSVVDQAALTKAIREKGVRAGLDVFADEPGSGTGEFVDEIVNVPGVYGTHHVGASTQQAQEAIAAETVRIVTCYLKTGEVPNCVNRAAQTTATILLTVRHLNKPGVLAHVFYTLGQAGINVEEMENIIYDGANAACARIQLDDMPNDEHMQTIGNNESVLSIDLQKIRN